MSLYTIPKAGYFYDVTRLVPIPKQSISLGFDIIFKSLSSFISSEATIINFDRSFL